MKQQSPLRNRVKELRARLGIRQADLAREVGITRQTIIAIEKGRLNPSIVICLKVARLLREPVDYIFYLEPGWEEAGMSAEAVAALEAVPKASTRVRVTARKSEKPKTGEDGERIPEPETVAATVRTPSSAARDHEADAGAEEAEAAPAAKVPSESGTREKSPKKRVRESVAQGEEEKTSTGTEKQGQAIWDFF